MILIFVLAQLTLAQARAYCTFGQSCWPSSSSWASFNSSITGQLLSIDPPAAVCHGERYNKSACNIAQANWTNARWRADQSGASQQTNWENGDSRCFIDSPLKGACEQGLVPVVGVAAESADHIQKAVVFAAKNNLFLVIKNTGHD